MEFFKVILIIGLLLFILLAGYLIGRHVTQKKFEEKIPELREDAIKQSRAVLSGQFSEQIAPYLPDFPYLFQADFFWQIQNVVFDIQFH